MKFWRALKGWIFTTLPFGTAVRMQLNPHFLFNSLNAITVLVRDQNTAAASRMLELLSDVLRLVLRREASHEAPLATSWIFWSVIWRLSRCASPTGCGRASR